MADHKVHTKITLSILRWPTNVHTNGRLPKGQEYIDVQSTVIRVYIAFHITPHTTRLTELETQDNSILVVFSAGDLAFLAREQSFKFNTKAIISQVLLGTHAPPP